MRWYIRICLLGLVASWPSCGFARSTLDDFMQRVIGMALANIEKANCGAGPCAPATAQERGSPPLTVAEAKMVFDRGMLSAAGEHCGLDWQKQNFLPMMAYWRNAQRASERKLALIGLVHGIAQGMGKPDAEKRGPCTDADRKQIEARLAFRA